RTACRARAPAPRAPASAAALPASSSCTTPCPLTSSASRWGTARRYGARGVALIVEDDKLVARTLARGLPSVLDVQFASTRASALRLVEAPLDLTLALLDVRLGPHAYGGLDVLERIASRRPTVVTA